MTLLAFKRLQRTSCCLLEASNWCPGCVSSQYLTSTRCISLISTLSSWALRTSLLGCKAIILWTLCILGKTDHHCLSTGPQSGALGALLQIEWYILIMWLLKAEMKVGKSHLCLHLNTGRSTQNDKCHQWWYSYWIWSRETYASHQAHSAHKPPEPPAISVAID